MIQAGSGKREAGSGQREAGLRAAGSGFRASGDKRPATVIRYLPHMATICRGCGHEASAEALFCPECGRSLRVEQHSPRRTEPLRHRERAGFVPSIGTGGDGESFRPRPAAQIAHRPLSFPSPIGAAMTIGGAILVLVGAIILRLPDDPLTVFGYAGGRWLSLGCGVLIVVCALAGYSSPSRFMRWSIALVAIAAGAVAIIDSGRLVGRPRGAGFGLTLVGAVIAVGGTMLRQER